MPLRHGGGRRERRRKTDRKCGKGGMKIVFSSFFFIATHSEAALLTSRARPRLSCLAHQQDWRSRIAAQIRRMHGSGTK